MDEIELNGVKYIRKDLAEERIRDAKILKQEIDVIFSEAEERIAKLIESGDTSAEKIIQEPNTVRLSPIQIEELLMPSSFKLYSDVYVNTDGSIRLGSKIAQYTIKDVREIEADIEEGVLNRSRISYYKNKLSISIQQMHRVIYNILHGMFNGVENHSTVKQESHPVRKYKNNMDMFDPSSYINATKPYHIHTMEETGKLCGSAKGSSFNLNIQQVLQIQTRICQKNITVGRAKQIAKDIDISYPTMCRIAWNIDNGYFDAFIREWKARLNNFVDDTVFDWGKQVAPIENNPEKRRDNGYYISQ